MEEKRRKTTILQVMGKQRLIYRYIRRTTDENSKYTTQSQQTQEESLTK